MAEDAAALARRLSQAAEATCRHYLSNGRREGRWWLVGDADNTPGRSLFVRLQGPEAGRGAAGKWRDAATGEHGDLLDLIARACRLDTLPAVLDEARRFLSLPRRDHQAPRDSAPAGSPHSARRLWHSGQQIAGTLAETYLRRRGITQLRDMPALRFHPRCFHRRKEDAPFEAWPALLAAVTDLDGTITGVQRTWLARDGRSKAPLPTPRRAMGRLLGNGVRFGKARDVLAVGEGIETMLSLRNHLPDLPMVAALSAAHLAALVLPATLRRLYFACDNDAAGRAAMTALGTRCAAAGIEVLPLLPDTDDFNGDLRHSTRAAMTKALRRQLAPDDVARFLGR